MLDSKVPSPVRRQVEEQKAAAAVNEWGGMPNTVTLNAILSCAIPTNEVHQIKEKIR